LNPARQRQVPEHFSWLDHRLREHYIERADVCAWALYLFLLSVADVHGLSYYSDRTRAQRLRFTPERLALSGAEPARLSGGGGPAAAAALGPGGTAIFEYATWCAIRDGFAQHLGARQLARQLGLNVKTVRRWRERPYAPRAVVPRLSKLDPFKGRIVAWLDAHPLRGCEIFLSGTRDGHTGDFPRGSGRRSGIFPSRPR